MCIYMCVHMEPQEVGVLILSPALCARDANILSKRVAQCLTHGKLVEETAVATPRYLTEDFLE